MRRVAPGIVLVAMLFASAGLEDMAQGTGETQAKDAQAHQAPGEIELLPAAPGSASSDSIIATLISKLAALINETMGRPGAKMPRADFGQFDHQPRVDVASFGLTCSPADFVGRWERDISALAFAGQTELSWIEVTPTRISLFVDVQADPNVLEALERLAPTYDPAGQERKPSRRPPEGPFEVVAFDYSLRPVDHCAWEMSFTEDVMNRAGAVKVTQTCTVAAEYAALGTGTLSDKDDFLWERLNFYDCFPRAETIREVLNQRDLRLNQDMGTGMQFNFAHWLQHWKRMRFAAWWKP